MKERVLEGVVSAAGVRHARMQSDDGGQRVGIPSTMTVDNKQKQSTRTVDEMQAIMVVSMLPPHQPSNVDNNQQQPTRTVDELQMSTVVIILPPHQ
eukprot:1138629-Pelagomonas_calceolata.AAC.11